MADCPHCGCDPDTARWATVVIDSETEAPREASAAELEELYEVDILVDRCWIVAGPLPTVPSP